MFLWRIIGTIEPNWTENVSGVINLWIAICPVLSSPSGLTFLPVLHHINSHINWDFTLSTTLRPVASHRIASLPRPSLVPHTTMTIFPSLFPTLCLAFCLLQPTTSSPSPQQQQLPQLANRRREPRPQRIVSTPRGNAVPFSPHQLAGGMHKLTTSLAPPLHFTWLSHHIQTDKRAVRTTIASSRPPCGHIQIKSLAAPHHDFGYLAKPSPPTALTDFDDPEEDFDLLSYQAGASLKNALSVVLEPNSLFSEDFNILAKTGENEYSYLGASGSEDGFSSSIGLASALDVAYTLTTEDTRELSFRLSECFWAVRRVNFLGVSLIVYHFHPAGTRAAMHILQDDLIEGATWKLQPDKTLRATYSNKLDKTKKVTLFYITDASFPAVWHPFLLIFSNYFSHIYPCRYRKLWAWQEIMRVFWRFWRIRLRSKKWYDSLAFIFYFPLISNASLSTNVWPVVSFCTVNLIHGRFICQKEAEEGVFLRIFVAFFFMVEQGIYKAVSRVLGWRF